MGFVKVESSLDISAWNTLWKELTLTTTVEVDKTTTT